MRASLEVPDELKGVRFKHVDGSYVGLGAVLEALAEDVFLVLRRPGSWEGSQMAQLLKSHGYAEVTFTDDDGQEMPAPPGAPPRKLR